MASQTASTETIHMRKTKSNLYLYTFLGLLFGFAALVDVGSLANAGVNHQQQATTDFIQGSGL